MESQSSSTVSSTSHGSRPSTPPTDLSSTLSSPTFAPPAETEDMVRRRQQSDLASTEIGKRLLKGWAMLGEECPSARCYGVPLVRPPKTGIDKDPRKVCGYLASLDITYNILLTGMCHMWDHIHYRGLRRMAASCPRIGRSLGTWTRAN